MGNVFEQTSNFANLNEQDIELWSLTVEDGLTPKSERYNREFLVKKEDNFKEVRPGDIVYNPMNMTLGAVGYNGMSKSVAVSGYYTTMIAKSDNDAYYINTWLKSPQALLLYKTYATGSLIEKQRVQFPTLSIIPAAFPSYAEQRKMGRYFKELDSLITLHQRKLFEAKNNPKNGLKNFFRKIYQKLYKFDFNFKTYDWEQRKFGETVTIERGGSPRPISDYVTKGENGLNWVKIGDAPEEGNYITQTAEKIIPEGLPKTREVHPGDLILSNSMSFGRPYIMAIDGCIHDGWLLIRDTQNNFDLNFLCVLLGTDNMLSQYKAMAAGSTVNNLNKELVGGTTVSYPSNTEQQKIGEYFSNLDRLITLHQREVFYTLKHIFFKCCDTLLSGGL